MMVPSLPCCLWNWTICAKGKSQMTSELSTKKGSSLEARVDCASLMGPAVPSGSSSSENVISMPSWDGKVGRVVAWGQRAVRSP